MNPQDQTPRQRLHPMIWVATTALTAFSLVGIGALTGIIPIGGKPAPQELAAAPAATAPVAPAQPAAQSAAPEAKTAVQEAPPPHHAALAETQQARPKVTHTEPRRTEHRASETRHTESRSAASSEPSRDIAREDVRPATDVRPAQRICADCGIVESIQPVQAKGEGSGIGVVAGGVLGGVLGHQVGKGTGKDLATIGGAVLGGIAGNQVEKNVRSSTRYEVTLRMDDGSRRVVTENAQPGWREGDRVRLTNGHLSAVGSESSSRGSSSF